MIVINPANTRFWSILGPRGAFGVALLEIAKGNEKVMAVTADLAITAGLDRFKKDYPNRLINTGIAEQNMIGVAAAFANEGFIPFAISFANFSVLRACEATRHFLGYMQRNVKLVGLSSGFAMGMFGNTHYGIEDIAIIRAIPGITILSPADSTEVVKATEAASNFNGPVYLRLTGVMNNPIVYKEDYNFKIGKAITLTEEGDITVFATGSMVYNSIEAAKILKDKQINVCVINIHTIKPLDKECIDVKNKQSKLLVSVEEHSKIGGLGGAIAEHLCSYTNHAPLLRLGISDQFRPAGDYKYLLEQNELLPEQIAAAIEKKYLSL
ncbi:MAG TPA: transketolase C-terminal domain-containing protein [Bacteroidales bacterium]|nr:transketolase C-terminal domain-containing protein [Bacteroidales bacterium]